MESPPAKRSKMADAASAALNIDKSKILPGDQFKELVAHKWYLDKTLFIKAALCDLDAITLIQAPRRFGKSSNMNMLKKFIEIEMDKDGEPVDLIKDDDGLLQKEQQNSTNFKLFENSKIFFSATREFNQTFFTNYFGRYPVIYANFKEVMGNNFAAILKCMRDVICESFTEHRYLLQSGIWNIGKNEYKKEIFESYIEQKNESLTEEDLIEGLSILAKFLCAHFRGDTKVYVLIDEYDAPILSAMYNRRFTYGNNDKSKDDLDKLVSFIGDLMSNILKDNVYVERALLNASHHVGEVLSPWTNNLIFCPFLQKPSKPVWEFYGFTGGEVRDLLTIEKLTEEKMNEVEFWYNGYGFKRGDAESEFVDIYCPWSILNYLKNEESGNYWVGGSIYPLKDLLVQDPIKNKIWKLMYGEEKSIAITARKKLTVGHIKTLKKNLETDLIVGVDEMCLFIQFLYGHGYLSVKSSSGQVYTLKIPNREISLEFENDLLSVELINKYFGVDRRDIESYIKAIRSLAHDKNKESVINLANAIKKLFTEGEEASREFGVHSFLYVPLKHEFKWTTWGEWPVPSGCRCDIATIVPDKTGLILELKVGDHNDSKKALNQILDKKYYTIREFKGTTVDNIYLGIHLSKNKNISITYLINDINRDNADTVCNTC